MLRVFIAVDIPAKEKNKLAEIQKTLKRAGAELKLTGPENIHLTIKFIGDIEESSINGLAKCISECLEATKEFGVRIAEVGAFPAENKPSIIWAGLDKGADELKAIHGEINEKLDACGYSPKDDRPFLAHATLARVKSGSNRNKLSQIIRESRKDKKLLAWEEFTVEKVALYKSTLTAQGPVYEILKEFSLRRT